MCFAPVPGVSWLGVKNDIFYALSDFTPPYMSLKDVDHKGNIRLGCFSDSGGKPNQSE